MAPSNTVPIAMLLSRQSGELTPPTCVTSCMATGEIGNCQSLLDFACICTSSVYKQSVAVCMGATCNATEIIIGQEYAAAACAAHLGTNGTNASAPGVDTTSPPVIGNHDFMNIQAIMSSICGALLLIAIGIGIVSCRNAIKREQVATHGSWTNAGTLGGDTKHGDFTYSRNASNFGGNSRLGQTSTFMTINGDDDFISTVPTLPMGRGGERSFGAARGFSNRFTLSETPEEWEMDAKASPDSQGSLKKEAIIPEERQEDVITPTTFASGRNQSEVELGSTVHLTASRGGQAM